MASLQYRGRFPDSDGSLAHKLWADGENQSVIVSTGYVNAHIASVAASNVLQLPGYVDTQDGLRAQKTEVDAADATYVAATKLGVAGGVASLNGSGNLTLAQVPAGVITDRVAFIHDVATSGQVFLAPGNTHTVTTEDHREFKLASILVPDHGYPWRPFPLAMVAGYSSATPLGTGDRTRGTNNLGLLTVMPPVGNDTIYGAGVCAGIAQRSALYPVLPYGASDNTPGTNPAIIGPLELDLWACNYALSGYVFLGLGLSFQILVVPAI